jgi:hypothetical protein
MKTDGNYLYESNKPKYITKYQQIFNDILKENSLNNISVTSRFKGNQNKSSFYNKNKLLNSNTLNLESNQSNLLNTRYHIITGKKFDIDRNNNLKDFNKPISYNNKYQNNNPEFLLRNLRKKQNSVTSFKEFIKKTEKKYENYNDNKKKKGNLVNHNRTRNLSNNAFIEKLYTSLPEYKNLTTRGQTFLISDNIKNKDFTSLKNKLKHF